MDQPILEPDQGPLQTGEHIMARLIQNDILDAKIGVAKFNPEEGILEVITTIDLRKYFNIENLEKEVNKIISQNLEVTTKTLNRDEAEKQIDISKVPSFVKEIRLVKIGDFDIRPCRDPHVKNTEEIGYFKMTKLKRAGKDRYRFSFIIL